MPPAGPELVTAWLASEAWSSPSAPWYHAWASLMSIVSVIAAAVVAGTLTWARSAGAVGQDGLNVLQGHVEGSEAADDLGCGDLIGLIAAIAGVGVDSGGLEHADAVVVAQRLDAEVRCPSEATDRQGRGHVLEYRVSPQGRVKSQIGS